MRCAVLVCVALVAAGCGGGARPATGLSDRHPCDAVPGFTCATLTVPLDHGGRVAGSLRLAVGIQDVRAAPRGVLLFLAGGPGQPGVPLIRKVHARLAAALAGYRLVMFDQRGTGEGALKCPALQHAAGSSDLAVAAPGTVAACARRLGANRRYFTTPETLVDIDRLRAALGVQRLTLDGVSYGTFVAEHYALAYPRHAARLILDSVVPQTGADPLYLASIQETSQVLRAACAAQRCGTDPAGDLAALIRDGEDGRRLLDAIVADSIAVPSFPGVASALHQARAGRPRALRAFLAAVHRGEAAPAPALSQALHESTLCSDLGPPWNPAVPAAIRAAAVRAAAARLPAAAFFPFDRATATGNGIVRGCLEWPATARPSVASVDPARPLPAVPVLLLAGGRDLSTPLAWARSEARRAPAGHLVVVPNAGHSVQLRRANTGARVVLARFLAGERP